MLAAAIKFNNKLIYNEEIEFFWKDQKQTIERLITPNDGAIIIEYEIGYFINNNNQSSNIDCNRKSLHLKILNNNVINEINERYSIGISQYINITNMTSTYFDNKHEETKNNVKKLLKNDTYRFQVNDTGKLILNIVDGELSEEEKNRFNKNLSWLDGVHVMINNQCINLRALKNGLLDVSKTM